MAQDLLNLRNATLNDLVAVDALLAASYPALLRADYAPSVMATAVPMLCRAQPRLLGSGKYLVICGPDGAIRAAGGWSWTAPAGGLGPADMGHIRHVATDPRFVRQGLGRQVMEAIMVTAQRDGVRQLDCLSTLTAAPFYRSVGFRDIGEIEIRLAPGILFPAVRMQREI